MKVTIGFHKGLEVIPNHVIIDSNCLPHLLGCQQFVHLHTFFPQLLYLSLCHDDQILRKQIQYNQSSKNKHLRRMFFKAEHFSIWNKPKILGMINLKYLPTHTKLSIIIKLFRIRTHFFVKKLCLENKFQCTTIVKGS